MHIHFSNLNKETTPRDIYTLLEKYTSIGNCSICHIKDISTRLSGTFAMVDIDNLTELEDAIKVLNGTMFGGRKIIVQIGR